MSFLNKIFRDYEPKDTPQNALKWNELIDLTQLDDIASESAEIPVVIFKHSTRCGISRMSLKGFEKEYDFSTSQLKPYYLDLLNHRDISNAIAEKFGVYHESPQLLLVKDGKVVFHASHGDISAKEVRETLR